VTLPPSAVVHTLAEIALAGLTLQKRQVLAVPFVGLTLFLPIVGLVVNTHAFAQLGLLSFAFAVQPIDPAQYFVGGRLKAWSYLHPNS